MKTGNVSVWVEGRLETHNSTTGGIMMAAAILGGAGYGGGQKISHGFSLPSLAGGAVVTIGVEVATLPVGGAIKGHEHEVAGVFPTQPHGFFCGVPLKTGA